MDLTKQFPRSPYDTLAGLVWLPRLIDKAHASHAGTLGAYQYDSITDKGMFGFLGITAEAFLQAVKENETDDKIATWVKANARPLTDDEIKGFNSQMINYSSLGNADGGESFFLGEREKIAPGRTDITTWFHLDAVEEGYPVPVTV